MVLVAILALPLRIIAWVFRHPRVLILVVILVFAVMGFRACQKAMSPADATVTPDAPKQRFMDKAPDSTAAPYILATPSRTYYVTKYNKKGNIITLIEYYTYDKKKWQLQTQPLPMDKRYFGEIKLYERKA